MNFNIGNNSSFFVNRDKLYLFSRSKSLKFKFNKPSLKTQFQTLSELETIQLNIIAQPRTQTSKPRYKYPNNKFSKGINMEQDNQSLEMRTMMVYYMKWI
ncbi:hypothetical protein pb186bvf_020348 [Paramecium bursaria]